MDIENQIIELREDNLSKAIFRIASSVGETDSEKELIRLIKKSCLSLWTIPNPYIEKGHELIDVLIIFGNDILLISDKNRQAKPGSTDLEIWAGIKDHLDKSSKQLKYAKKELDKNPAQIYLDNVATQAIDLTLPPAHLRRYHLITVLRGYENGAKSYLENNEGNFLIDTKNYNLPYVLPKQQRSLFFMHIFDSVGLDKIIKELTTVKDLINYLDKREDFFKNNEIIAPSEDALLTSYFSSYENEESPTPFLYLAKKNESELVFSDNLYQNYTGTEKYKTVQDGIRASLYVDLMIEKLILMGNPKEIDAVATIDTKNTVYTIEHLAKLTRDDRVSLYNCIHNLHINLPNDGKIKIAYNYTYLYSLSNYLIIYLLLRKNEEQTIEEYRKERADEANTLKIQMQYKAENHEINTFVVIATDMPNNLPELISIDLYVFN